MLFLFLLFCFCSAIEFDCPGNPKDKPKDIPQVCQGVNDSGWGNFFYDNIDYCICKDDFIGDDCDKCDEKHKDTVNCVRANVDGYKIVDNKCTCICKTKFYGPICDKTACKADYVEKNGKQINVCDEKGTKSVVDGDGNCKCNCKEGWYGEFCENHDKITCIYNPQTPNAPHTQCSEMGTRKIEFIDGVCICHCKPRYFGIVEKRGINVDCYLNCEVGSYCHSKGTKKAEWEGGVCFCRCAEDYYGPKCDERCVGWNAASSGCNEIGTESLYIEGDKCKCKCMEGYYGEKCANQCNNYNGDGRSTNCFAEGTETAQINNDECICKCKEGFYGNKCLKCKISEQNDRPNQRDFYCGPNSNGGKPEGDKCICTCKQPEIGGDQCEINCKYECGDGTGKWAKKKCECTCNDIAGTQYSFFKDINGVCKTQCNKEGAKDITKTKCTCGGTKCKDRFGGNKCQFDKYTGHSEIMGNAVAGIAIIIIGIWI